MNTSQAQLGVVILAAGESRRMGQPKALLPFPAAFSPTTSQKKTDRLAAQAAGDARLASAKAKTFLEHLIEVTRHERAGILRVVVGAHAEEIRARVKLEMPELVVNENWQRGQLSSLQAAIRSLPAGATDGMLVCLVDHPLISRELVARLMEGFKGPTNTIVIPTYQGRRGHPVIFPASLYEELLAANEEVGARAVVRAHGSDVLEIPVEEEGVLLNLNDPETLRKVAT